MVGVEGVQHPLSCKFQLAFHWSSFQQRGVSRCKTRNPCGVSCATVHLHPRTKTQLNLGNSGQQWQGPPCHEGICVTNSEGPWAWDPHNFWGAWEMPVSLTPQSEVLPLKHLSFPYCSLQPLLHLPPAIPHPHQKLLGVAASSQVVDQGRRSQTVLSQLHSWGQAARRATALNGQIWFTGPWSHVHSSLSSPSLTSVPCSAIHSGDPHHHSSISHPPLRPIPSPAFVTSVIVPQSQR